MQNRNEDSKNYKYQIRFKFKESVNATMHTDSLNRALEVAAIQMETHTKADCRTGSLRGDGRVNLWENGEKAGYVTVEEYKHGQYVQIGG